MRFARLERADFCDAALAVGASAPTLCAGWTAADLVAHVWTRENDALSLPGVVIPALGELTDARRTRALDHWGFRGLVELLREGPPATSVFGLPGVDEAANTVELFVHTEDLRRPNGLAPRQRTTAFEDWMWERVARMAALFFRGAASGITLERLDGGASVRVRPGTRNVTLVGVPSELVLFVFGRTANAAVDLFGPSDAVARVREEHTGL